MTTQTTRDLGRYQLGQEVPLALQCLLGDAPDTPDSHPTFEVRADASASWTIYNRIAADEQGITVGFFRQPMMLDARFAAGRYTVRFRWQDSGANHRTEMHSFQVLPGGNADGAIIAMHHAERPQGRFLIMQTDTGLLKRGLNPR